MANHPPYLQGIDNPFYTEPARGSGTPLFSMSASVGVDAEAFNSGITSITTAINTLNTNITAMLTAIESIAEASKAALALLSTEASTAAAAVETAADGLSDSDIEDVVETLEDLKEEYGEAAETAETAEATMTSAATGAATAAGTMAEAVEGAETTTASAATGAASAAGEMAKAVDEVGKSAQKSSFSFADMAYAAYKVFGVVKDIAGALWNFGTEMVDAAVSYEMSMRTYATAFTGIEEEAAAAMAELSDETGLYAGVIRGNFAAMQTQFRSAGYEQSDALELSQRAMSLAADAAAHYGITLDEATRKVMSFLRGNQEGGESIGMFISQATREEYANSLYGKAWKELSEAERQAALLQIAEATYATGGQQGAAARYSDSFIVAQQNLQQRWADIMGQLGTPIMEAITPVMDELFAFLSSTEGQQAVNAFVDLIRQLVTALSDLFTSLLQWLATPEHVNDLTNIITSLSNVLGWLFGYTPPQSAVSADYTVPEDVDSVTSEDGVYNVSAVEAAEQNYADLAEALTMLFEAATTEGTEDDLAASDAIDALVERGLLNDTATGYLFDLFDMIESGGIGALGEGMTVEDLVQTILSDEYSSIEESLRNIYQDVSTTNEGVISAVNALPGVLASALSGITVQMNGVTVGHLVAPTVMADMSRNAKFGQYTTAGTTA